MDGELWLASIIVLILLLLDDGGRMENKRYTLSAMNYDEETGRPKSLGIYKTEDIHTHALRTADLMLDVNPEAMLIEIYDNKSNTYEQVSRLNNDHRKVG
jgi:hypothetical protein